MKGEDIDTPFEEWKNGWYVGGIAVEHSYTLAIKNFDIISIFFSYILLEHMKESLT
jgi:hypothetical protein